MPQHAWVAHICPPFAVVGGSDPTSAHCGRCGHQQFTGSPTNNAHAQRKAMLIDKVASVAGGTGDGDRAAAAGFRSRRLRLNAFRIPTIARYPAPIPNAIDNTMVKSNARGTNKIVKSLPFGIRSLVAHTNVSGGTAAGKQQRKMRRSDQT